MANIVLVGMPGCGKSTVGVLLAKRLGLDFMDTDVVLQAREGDRLQKMIDEMGVDAFLKKEEEAILSISCDRTVIATGGSVIYGRDGMRHLRENGVVVYISLPFEEIERRLSNLATRGVTLRPGQTLRDLYNERVPLYEAQADIVILPKNKNIEQTVAKAAAMIAEYTGEDYGE